MGGEGKARQGKARILLFLKKKKSLCLLCKGTLRPPPVID
jgi:hypothetical protein